MLKLIFALIAVAVAVPAGGLLAGVDRRLTARLQSRQGPPLLQPFYDVLKLFGKAPCVTNPWLIFSSYVCLMASAIALLMFFMQGDMLLLFFVMTVGAVFKVAGRAFRRLALQQRGRAARTAPDARLRAAGHPHLRGACPPPPAAS